MKQKRLVLYQAPGAGLALVRASGWWISAGKDSNLIFNPCQVRSRFRVVASRILQRSRSNSHGFESDDDRVNAWQ